MLQNLGGWHLVVIVFIVLLLFGAPKLPGLAKSLGQSMRILKKEVSSDAGSEKSETASAGPASQTGSATNSDAAKPASDVVQTASPEPNTDVR